jgi:hypothetical protein
MTNEVNDIPTLQQLHPGDRIYARGEIRSNGSIPGLEADAAHPRCPDQIG